MRVEISSAALHQILAEAAAAPEREICGLLHGIGDRIDDATACRNVAGDPARAFEIDPARLIAAYRAMRAGGPRVIGHYHSHPAGSAIPSARDAAAAPADGALWLIVAGDVARAWRAVDGGAVQGRFEAVTLVVR